MINIYNMDCLEAMQDMKDNQYDLAIVDPPYGMVESGMQMGGHVKGKKFNRTELNKWDIRPSKEYFVELLRVSKNQIIWGGNFFCNNLPISRAWLCWDKIGGDNLTCVNNELAWTSFTCALKMFRRHQGKDKGFMLKKQVDKKIHPTQKPVALYTWILNNYAKEGDKILDTHLGSGSIAIACHDMGYSLDGYELDTEYYEGGKHKNRHKWVISFPT